MTTSTPEATKLPDMFGEVDIPVQARIGATRFENPFLDVVKARVGVAKALTFDLKNITDPEDDEETLKRVQSRARRMLDEAGDKATSDKNPEGVTVRMVKDDTWTITFWVLDYKVKREPKATTEAPAETPPAE